jgi:hypothetical protein
LSADQSRDALQRAIHDFVMLSAFRDTEAAQAATIFLRSALDTNDIARRPISRDLT